MTEFAPQAKKGIWRKARRVCCDETYRATRPPESVFGHLDVTNQLPLDRHLDSLLRDGVDVSVDGVNVGKLF